MDDALSDLLSQVLREPPSRLDAFAENLETGRLSVPSTRARLQALVAAGPDSLTRLARLTKSWADKGGDADLLAAVIRSATEIAREIDSAKPGCELVWSGPSGGAQGVRATAPVIDELVQHAGRSITMVGYSLFLQGMQMQKLLGRLGERSSEGVDITFIVDGSYKGYDANEGAGHSIREIKKWWPKGCRRPAIWAWADENGQGAILHAKVVMSDDRDVLVTSANLTGAGLGKNMEVGLRVRGEPALRCAEHFRALIQSGAFQQVEW